MADELINGLIERQVERAMVDPAIDAHDRIKRLANVVFKLSMCITVPEDNQLAWKALKEIQDELLQLGAEVPK
jgi:hypothetical protein